MLPLLQVKVTAALPALPQQQELMGKLRPFHTHLAQELDARRRPVHRISPEQVGQQLCTPQSHMLKLLFVVHCVKHSEPSLDCPQIRLTRSC